ncbi:MAG: hypothetical protein IT580_21440, partial [Verrucomicrobiales bacterium]|nr:hypothetical protein [Verrucomicrobiales bacterium]
PSILKDEGSGSDYLTKKSVTNNLVIRTPYDMTFRAFSSELAAVLRGFAALDQLVVIKTINIDPTTLKGSGGGAVQMMTMMPSSPGVMPTPGGGMGGMDPALAQRYGLGAGGGRRPGEGGGGPGGMDPALASRYGLGGGGEAAMRSRYGGGPGGAAMTPPPALSQPTAPAGLPGAPAAPAGPAVVLDEKPLRVIMQIDFVKPKPAAESATRRAAPRATADPAAGDAGAGDAAAPAPEAPAE